ncbi:MAG: cell division protein FtsW [Clostridia bacterium]|nr:cell division protein FtsW [Clostridia bacterium]
MNDERKKKTVKAIDLKEAKTDAAKRPETDLTKRPETSGAKNKPVRKSDDGEIRTYRLDRFNGSVDNVFFILVIILLCVGSVMVLSASYYVANSKFGDSFYFARRQLLWAVGSIVILLLAARIIDYRWLRGKLSYIILFAAIGLCVLVLIPTGISHTANNATRWIDLGLISFQPSEILKLAVVLVCATYMSNRKSTMHKFGVGIVIPLVFMLGCCLLLAAQPHVSGAIIIAIIVVSMMFMGGVRIPYFAATVAALGAGAYGVFNIVKNQEWFKNKFHHVLIRLEVWHDPFNKEYFANEGWQPAQSLLAISSGGFWGVGLGRSIQKHGYLPEPQNDYIFSIVCEELGFFGAIIILALFVLLIIRGFKIASKAPDTFSSLVVYGIVIKLAVQVGLNILVVTNTIPSTGISLPFFSYGGTSLLLQMAEMGIVLAISKYSYQEK